jgi:hemin uptake protein HemP
MTLDSDGAAECPRGQLHTASSMPRPAVRSDDLFRGTHEIVIVHGDDEYRLRITRAGKLILTK